MGPTGRDKQLATLGDIRMLAENLGQVENNHRNLVGNINDIVQWVQSIDQACFISIHFHVNSSIEFNEETVAKTSDFLNEARANMIAYQQAQDAKAKAEALTTAGDEFNFNGSSYKHITETLEETPEHPAGVTERYTANLNPISKEDFESAAFAMVQEKKQVEEQEKAEKERAALLDAGKPAEEASQAPAEPQAPVEDAAPADAPAPAEAAPAEAADGAATDK